MCFIVLYCWIIYFTKDKIGGENLENKELVTSGKITQTLIGNWLLWGIVFGMIYSFIYKLIASSMESMVGVAVVAIVLQGITAILVWKCSTISSFKILVSIFSIFCIFRSILPHLRENYT